MYEKTLQICSFFCIYKILHSSFGKMPSGAPQHYHIHKEFTLLPLKAEKIRKVECKHCHIIKAQNTSRQREHLKICTIFQEFLQRKGGISKLFKASNQSSLPTINAIKRQPLDLKLAKAIFVTGKPFSTFDDPTFQEFFGEFGYKLPTRQAFGGSLLDEVYENVKKDVENQLRSSPFLSFTTDESSNITTDRMINYSVLTSSQDCFYWKTVEAAEGALTAEILTSEFLKIAKELTNNDLSRVNALTTDTCSTMMSMWDKLHANSATNHILTIPCDSHGIQLLIKDLLDLGGIKTVWKQANSIISSFRSSPKQLKYLRIIQKREYGRQKALIASVITRWGTQVSGIQI
jgi:hypothetical protein